MVGAEHAPQSATLKIPFFDSRPSHPPVLLSDAPLTQFQGFGHVSGKRIFNSRFRVEAKEFVVSVNEYGTVKLIEWGQKISNTICLGKFSALWMVNMVGKLRVVDKFEDFVAKHNEASRAFLAQRNKNSRGRYLTSTVWGEGSERSCDGARRCEWREMGVNLTGVSGGCRFFRRRREG